MIVDMVRGDVFKSKAKHIVFAVNTSGDNNSGFAGQVAQKYWPGLANTGKKRLGVTMSRKVRGKTFYAIVCHYPGRGGWKKSPQKIETGLNLLDIPFGEAAVVLMGAGLIGELGGADLLANLGAFARSNKRLVVYTL